MQRIAQHGEWINPNQKKKKKSTHVGANSDRANHNKIRNQNQVNNCKEQQQHQFISEWT